jgi:hypothetical protein
MWILLEVLKGVFFFLSIVVGLFFLRWDTLIAKEYYVIVKQILMPWYLLFCWVMIGYIISRVWVWYDDERDDKTKIFTKSFIIGISIGVVLALLYIII